MNYDEYIKKVKRFYSPDTKKYHTIHHVRDLFNLYEKYRFEFLKEFSDLNEEDLFEAIAWHDSVYIPGCELNEDFSAQLYSKYMLDNGLQPKLYVYSTIVSTKIGTHSFFSNVEKVMHDLDWNSFGWPYHIFKTNTEKILYEATCEFRYTVKEVKKNQFEFYKSLLGKDIFVTKTFSKFNEIAKQNLDKIIKEMENEEN